jgi:ethanolamine utilization protein EutN
MRIAEVIGTVTLSRGHPTLVGIRFVIAVPFSLKALEAKGPPDGEDVIVVDQLGAGPGSRIGISEGTEASMPFRPARKPIDAFCACILDSLSLDEAR